MLFITVVQKSKSISKDWFYLLNEIKSIFSFLTLNSACLL